MISNKSITIDEYNRIVSYQRINFGGEAIICESDNPYTLYKIFNYLGSPKAMSKNKENKIELLHELKPKYSVEPISTISLNDVIVGYEMSTDFGLESYKTYELSPEELKYFLTETKRILEYFNSIGIIYGDVEPRNILFNRDTGEIKFCDMDNISINGLPMDTIPFNLQVYEQERDLDYSVHPFMHNIMTLRAIGLDSYWASHLDLRRNLKRPGYKTVLSMSKPSKFNNEYILPYVKKLTRDKFINII